MKVKKQLKRLQVMLDASERERHKRRNELKELLSAMKSKEKHLAKKIDGETDAEKKTRLQQEITLLHAQRKKGIKALKALKASNA